MNIDDLTVEDAKFLASMFGSKKISQPVAAAFIGKYVLVRSRNEGVNAGYVAAADDTGVVLKSARRLWYHEPQNKSVSWYEGVAVSGLSSESKVSAAVERKAIIEDYSLTECSEVAKQSIEAAVTHAQN